MLSMADLSEAKGRADEALAWTVAATDWGLVGMNLVEAFALAWIAGVTDWGLVGMHLAESMAEDVELVVTRTIPVERADLELEGTGWVENNQTALASTLVEYGSVVGDPNNTLQILPDVDLPAVGRSRVNLLYHTACHKGPTEYPGTVVGRPGTLGWQVGFHLPSEPAVAEALACLGDMAFSEGTDRHRCIHCHHDHTTWVLSWPFATSLRLYPWSVRLAWTRVQCVDARTDVVMRSTAFVAVFGWLYERDKTTKHCRIGEAWGMEALRSERRSRSRKYISRLSNRFCLVASPP
jgi:hypothetical protein